MPQEHRSAAGKEATFKSAPPSRLRANMSDSVTRSSLLTRPFWSGSIQIGTLC